MYLLYCAATPSTSTWNCLNFLERRWCCQGALLVKQLIIYKTGYDSSSVTLEIEKMEKKLVLDVSVYPEISFSDRKAHLWEQIGWTKNSVLLWKPAASAFFSPPSQVSQRSATTLLFCQDKKVCEHGPLESLFVSSMTKKKKRKKLYLHGLFGHFWHLWKPQDVPMVAQHCSCLVRPGRAFPHWNNRCVMTKSGKGMEKDELFSF